MSLLGCGVSMIMEIDETKLSSTVDSVDLNSECVKSIIDDLVSSCCSSLDKYVDYVSNILNDQDNEMTNEELDDIVMTIPTILYSVGVAQENLGIRHDVSSSQRQLMYNKIYTETAGTAGVKKAIAENDVFYESLTSLVYDRAYTIIKSKVNFAFEILQSAKKVMSRRISEQDLSRSDTGKSKV